jgi:PKD repeat protein
MALVLPATSRARAEIEYQFTDVTDLAGVADAEHPHFGATWSDYDGDGFIDLYVVNGKGEPLGVEDENVLYRNNGDGTFTDVTIETGTGDPYVAMRNIWADYDRDGDLDLYSHNFVVSTLYQNNDDVFSDVNEASGAGLEMDKGTGAAWGDYDNDGWLDIHATGFPGQNALLHNNGDGTFTNLQTTSGMSLSASGMGNAWGDYDLDGDLDMAITAVTKDDPTFLYENNGDGTFKDVTVEVGIIVEDGSSNAAVNWADYDNDGDWDLHITEVNAGSAKVLPNRMYLFQNQGDNTFIDATSDAGLTPPSMSEIWDAAFADFDNDGDIDLYVAGTGPDLFYLNNGDGTFTDIASDVGVGITDTTWGIVWGDYDNDGDADMYVVRKGNAAPNLLLRNQGGSNNWLQLELHGTVSNLEAIGARITVVANGQTQMREITGGSGFYSQHTLVQQFGLGPSSTIESIEIVWPSGIVQNVSGLAINKRHVIIESGTGQPTASFTATPGAMPLDIDFDASSSSDDDEIVTYDWDFGDFAIGSGVTATHTYSTAGSYTVSLEVTDDVGLTGLTSKVVTVSDDANVAPTAAFSTGASGLSVTFTDESTDPDGTVDEWAWDFGDGDISTLQHPSHVYVAAGSYTVMLTATDNDGAADTVTSSVGVSEPGGEVSLHVGDLDGSTGDGSRDRWQATVTIVAHDANHDPVEGATVSGDWIEGANGSGSCVTDASGVCTITRGRIRASTTSITFATTDVTQDSLTYDPGLNHDPDTDSDGTEIVLSDTASESPSASFTWSCAVTVCDFTDTTSDPDGSVVSWLWEFGDINESSVQHPSHTYASEDTYTVTLTVTDDTGLTDSVSSSIFIGEPGDATSVHVADLDGVGADQTGGDWLATVSVSVVDESGVAVGEATATGDWRSGDVTTCTTDAAGTCDLEVLTGGWRTSLTVTSISHVTLSYDPDANTDPDGDSDGTVIVVNSP